MGLLYLLPFFNLSNCEYLLVGCIALVLKHRMENLPTYLTNFISYDPIFLFVDEPYCKSVQTHPSCYKLQGRVFFFFHIFCLILAIFPNIL